MSIIILLEKGKVRGSFYLERLAIVLFFVSLDFQVPQHIDEAAEFPPCKSGSFLLKTFPLDCYLREFKFCEFCTVYISWTKYSKTSLTFTSYTALVSIKRSRFLRAKSAANSLATFLSVGCYSARSSLFPTSMMTISGSACSRTSSIHFLTLMND